MRWLRDLPIQRKVLGMTLLICGTVLCLAMGALFAFQILNFRSNFRRDTTTLALIIANNSTAAMAFKDEEAASEVIGALKAEPSVQAATLALPDGTPFASFRQAEVLQTRSQFPPPGTCRFVAGSLLVTQPVKLKGERVGMLYLRADYRRILLGLLGFYGKVVLGIMLSSFGLAVLLSSRLGRTITDPLLRLAQTARSVGESSDYSLRVALDGRRDELGSLAESFNQMLSRVQSQDAALSLSQQRMEALINSIDGIVWERTPDTSRFTFVSRQSEGILGYPCQAWHEQANFWKEKLHPEDAERAARTGSEAAAKGQPYTLEYRMISADGRTVWIRESGIVLLEAGRPVAMRGIFLDITQQKLSAEQLDRLNRQLFTTSRLAGMAEVATGVLHNVGNVLNSVSVSATSVGERLRRSKLGNLRRATALLREQNGHLVEFLTSDPKGRILPEYLASLADHLAGEQTAVIARMHSIEEHIEHIKEIVAMQQNYAKVSGVYENLPVVELVEDALRMNAAAFERHGVELVREFDPNVPPVCVDRHKVLQILINLLRNAKYAMETQDGPAKRLLVRVSAVSPERVRISVLDNGIGIASENLTKIFSHGFTTKKDGHGFGLHSGANAAREMGGSLTAYSEGLQKGAEFTLELPTANARREPPPTV